MYRHKCPYGHFYKHIQYNYIGITTFRDLFIFIYFFKTSVAPPIMNQNVYGLIK